MSNDILSLLVLLGVHNILALVLVEILLVGMLVPDVGIITWTSNSICVYTSELVAVAVVVVAVVVVAVVVVAVVVAILVVAVAVVVVAVLVVA